MVREIKRQLVHFSGVFLVFTSIYYGKEITVKLTFFFLIFFILLSIAKKLSIKISKIMESIFKFADSFERKEKIPYKGAITFFFSSFILFLFGEKNLAEISIFVLCVYDSISTLYGYYFGRIRIFNQNKSIDGMVIGVLVSTILGSVFFNPLVIFFASIIGGIVEILPLKIDDNITIPFSVYVALLIFISFPL